MANRKFSKQALSLEQQITLLSNQGLLIDDTERAKQVLSVVSYYRLSGYALPFKEEHQYNSQRQFKEHVSFDNIWQLYQFDRELRLLVIDAIEKIEVAFRTSITNVMSVNLNPFWYVEKIHFRNPKLHGFLIKTVNQIISDKHEVFIKHYFTEYDLPSYPPLWMLIEALSFGTCSKLFTNIKRKAYKREICDVFKQSPTVIDSWMRSLTFIRNICAHHARLWNRWLVNPPILPKHESKRDYFYTEKNFKFHLIAYVIQNLLQEIAPKSPWRQKLFGLFEKYENFANFRAMGFKSKWREDIFWEL